MVGAEGLESKSGGFVGMDRSSTELPQNGDKQALSGAIAHSSPSPNSQIVTPCGLTENTNSRRKYARCMHEVERTQAEIETAVSRCNLPNKVKVAVLALVRAPNQTIMFGTGRAAKGAK